MDKNEPKGILSLPSGELTPKQIRLKKKEARLIKFIRSNDAWSEMTIAQLCKGAKISERTYYALMNSDSVIHSIFAEAKRQAEVDLARSYVPYVRTVIAKMSSSPAWATKYENLVGIGNKAPLIQQNIVAGSVDLKTMRQDYESGRSRQILNLNEIPRLNNTRSTSQDESKEQERVLDVSAIDSETIQAHGETIQAGAKLVKPDPPPRYDDVFFEGVKRLEEITTGEEQRAGEESPPTQVSPSLIPTSSSEVDSASEQVKQAETEGRETPTGTEIACLKANMEASSEVDRGIESVSCILDRVHTLYIGATLPPERPLQEVIEAYTRSGHEVDKGIQGTQDVMDEEDSNELF